MEYTSLVYYLEHRTQKQTAPPLCTKVQNIPEKLTFPFWKKKSGARKIRNAKAVFLGCGDPALAGRSGGAGFLSLIVFSRFWWNRFERYGIDTPQSDFSQFDRLFRWRLQARKGMETLARYCLSSHKKVFFSTFDLRISPVFLFLTWVEASEG